MNSNAIHELAEQAEMWSTIAVNGWAILTGVVLFFVRLLMPHRSPGQQLVQAATIASAAIVAVASVVGLIVAFPIWGSICGAVLVALGGAGWYFFRLRWARPIVHSTGSFYAVAEKAPESTYKPTGKRRPAPPGWKPYKP